MLDRREFLRVTAGATAGIAAGGCTRRERPLWDDAALRKTDRSSTAILRHAAYDEHLSDSIVRGIRLCGLQVEGRRVLLKPNLVEFDPEGVINTHPALVAAAIEAFRRLGAREVVVGEGPGHRRDNEYLLDASGLAYALRDTGCDYVDLNTDAVRDVRLPSHFTGMGSLYLPDTVLGADLLVSMPKLKTHKWAGVTLSLKNMFGVVPGAVYGWPKNTLHWHGITRSILDINAALQVPRFNIVDGIIGMEGNGPIQGRARHSGVLVFGADAVAVDATCARLMGLDPLKIGHIAGAGLFLGNAEESEIQQIGEPVETCRQSYDVLDSFAYLRA